ncbi:MAG: cupredoxin domain-containing protein [Solirubrobacteraceae bacterium]
MNSRKTLAQLALVVSGAVAVAGCGSSTGGSSSGGSGGSAVSTPHTPAHPGHLNVAIRGFAFAPAALTVRAGATLTFANDDQTAHTATSKASGVFDTGTVKPGGAATVTLTKPGTYTYYCVFHPFMTATVTVVK